MNKVAAANLLCVICIVAGTTSCRRGRAAPPPAPPYTAEYRYQVKRSATKLDVTLGIIGAQFSGEGSTYWTMNKSNEEPRRMVKALRGSFEELLSAKGFNTSGPFDSLDAMTFPEKKGADLVIYPDIDVQFSLKKAETPRGEDDDDDDRPRGAGLAFGQAPANNKPCNATASAMGTVNLRVVEPLSGEKIWVKRIELSVPPTRPEPARGSICASAVPGMPALPPGMPVGVGGPGQDIQADAWARVHQAVYTQVMENLDRYVSGEEFQVLKKQAAELRAKKVY